jgi:hypothetical protein
MRPTAITALLFLTLGSLAAAQEADKRPRLSPLDFKVIRSDQPVTGSYAFVHPVSSLREEVSLRESEAEGEALTGVLAGSGTQVLLLTEKVGGVGWQGELRGIFSECGQDRVMVTDLLPLGDKLIVRFEAEPPPTPCPFLENRETSRLVAAASTSLIRLRSLREIMSSSTREQIGLAGQPGGPSTPITAGMVSVEGGTELKFLGRTRSMDGSLWVHVEALVSPAPGIEPPEGYVRSDELRVDGSLTLERLSATATPPPGR